MSGKIKNEMNLDPAALSVLMTSLAPVLFPAASAGQEPYPDLAGAREIKFACKFQPDGSGRLKISVKYPKPDTGPEEQQCGDEKGDDGLPKYKSLKKHMKHTFKSMGRALAAGAMPDGLEAQSFIADSKLMVEYRGKGDEFYEAYKAKTLEFEMALASMDLDAVRLAYEGLARVKRECHSRHA
jgi:XXXCH domain-containing protein